MTQASGVLKWGAGMAPSQRRPSAAQAPRVRKGVPNTEAGA